MIYQLDSDWAVCERPLSCTAEQWAAVSANHADSYPCTLPCDVHMPLISAGKIHDPVLADYCFESEWISKRSWWFFRSLEITPEMMQCDLCELVLESVDTDAVIFWDGVPIGFSCDVHLPFVHDLKPMLSVGLHQLTIRVTTGLERVRDQDLAEIDWAACDETSNGCPERGDRRRAFVRRPQYSTGWDWNPKIPTCGITGHAFLRTETAAVVREAHLSVTELGNPARLRADIMIESLFPLATQDGSLFLEIRRNGHVCASAQESDFLLCSGYNYRTLWLTLPDPELWWPNGMGAQPLYTVSVWVTTDNHISCYPEFSFGVRTIELDTSRQDTANRAFTLCVNGVEMFCKGSNWIPCDSIYARVPDSKYETLVQGAADANLNMLRVWGGGLYERNRFYELCDEKGLLVWQDLMFACAVPPDHRPDFVRLCTDEIEFQLRRLRNHPCMGLICGNNEIQMIFHKATRLSDQIAPRLVRQLCPEIPYWNSSPYGDTQPNGDAAGDVHHWGACMMNRDMRKRIDPFEFDRAKGRFISEYGYPGPTGQTTMKEYYDGHPLDPDSRIGRLHTNTFEKDTVMAGIRKHYGASGALTLDQYLLYAGMVQGLMLNYSLEAFRFRTDCSGGMFWMFNDCWGEIGWTIMDYAARRKIDWYAVRRACTPVRAIIRAQNEEAVVLLANDTADPCKGQALVGIVSLDGSARELHPVEFTVPAHTRKVICRESIAQADLQRSLFVFIPSDDAVAEPAYLRAMDLCKLDLCQPKLRVTERTEGTDLLVTVQTDCFAHGVHFDSELLADDQYFDLLPGSCKTVRIYGAAGTHPEFKSVPVWHHDPTPKVEPDVKGADLQ